MRTAHASKQRVCSKERECRDRNFVQPTRASRCHFAHWTLSSCPLYLYGLEQRSGRGEGLAYEPAGHSAHWSPCITFLNLPAGQGVQPPAPSSCARTLVSVSYRSTAPVGWVIPRNRSRTCRSPQCSWTLPGAQSSGPGFFSSGLRGMRYIRNPLVLNPSGHLLIPERGVWCHAAL